MTTIYKQWSEFDINQLCGTTKPVDLYREHVSNDNMLKKVLWVLGLQSFSSEFESQLVLHRPLLSKTNEIKYGYLFTAPERTDDDWLMSEYSSVDVRQSMNKDAEMIKDMKLMSHVPNFTLEAMKAMEIDSKLKGESK
jgi:hypothetical protein